VAEKKGKCGGSSQERCGRGFEAGNGGISGI